MESNGHSFLIDLLGSNSMPYTVGVAIRRHRV
jgi:hypothetical protein